MKWGNRPDGTLPSKGRRREFGTVRRNDGRDTALTNRLNETRTGVTGNNPALTKVWFETTGLAKVAQPTIAEGLHQLEQDASAVGAVPAPAAAHRAPVHVAKPTLEEPDAGILHVRICGGPAGRPAGLPDSSPARSVAAMTRRTSAPDAAHTICTRPRRSSARST